jgi:hypothetical protein
MPIVSISRIQHRYGLSENLPQLAAAEFGWAIDQRRLFIGNGPTAEGAPQIGNTEILTQYSNLLEVAQNSYTYKDVAAGYIAITGESLTSPVTRSLQEKLDDVANVRDYGAKGNGIDDDTIYINRALADLYTRDANPSTRRVLYFPAGNYVVSDTIKIPAFATIQGEGKNCTIITARDSFADCVVRLADSKMQVGENVGSNGAVLPSYISVNDITFNANFLSMDVLIINSSNSVMFKNVGFSGGLGEAPTTSGSLLSTIKIFSSAINHTKNIIFENCEFTESNYAAILDDDMENIVFDKCYFNKLYLGFKIGENTTGSGKSIVGPVGLRITNSLFDEIFNSAIVNYKTAKITSAFNAYLSAGDQNISSPAYPVIIFQDFGGSSICDTFTRSETSAIPRVDYSNTKSVFIEASQGMFIGKRQISSGDVKTLTNNTSNTSTGIVFTVSQKAQKLHYIATRGTGVRNGVLEIVATATGITYSDSFTENGTDIGLTLAATVSGTNVTVKYTTTNTGSDVSFSYSVDRNIT